MLGFTIYKISGHSMKPTLPVGSFVLVWKTKHIRVGDIVAFHAPAPNFHGRTNQVQLASNAILIKRVAQIKEGQILLLGDNAHDSHDSKTFGTISLSNIIGKVIWH